MTAIEIDTLAGRERVAGRQVQARLPWISRSLHWLTALIVLGMVSTGVVMKQLGGGAVSDALYTLHKTTGVLLLVVVLLRLALRLGHRLAGGDATGHGGRAVHVCLYALLLLLPLLGWAGVSDFGARGVYFGLELPRIWPEGAGHAALLFSLHAWLAFAMLGLVTVHIGIALGDYVQRHSRRAERIQRGTSEREASHADRDMP